MTSPVAAEEHSNTKTEEGTTAFHKKRSRRVSFAENTSVHIFNREEEYETPPDPEPPNSPYEDLEFSRDNDSKHFYGNQEEDDEDHNMNEFGPRSPFLRVVRSPSSGGSTVGSVTSNDENKFFGPVSTRFIGRDLLDSAPSDDNDDVTMDSTTFSMRFHSIARSDSEAELKTSTGIHLSFEEKTTTPSSIPYDTRSPMLLERAKKPNSEPDVSTSKLSIGSQSNDMSLVGEYHDKYNYGKLLPAYGALLARNHDDLHVASHISVLRSPILAGKEILANMENGPHLMDFSYDQDDKMQGITGHEEFKEVVSVNHEMGTIDDVMEKENKSPLVRPITHFTERPGHTLLNRISQSKSPGTVTPSHIDGSVFLRTESKKHGGNVSSLQKSISKLRMLEASPFSAGLNAKLHDSNSRSLVGLSKMTPLDAFMEEKNKSPHANRMNNTGTEILDNHLEEPLPYSPQKKREDFSTNMNADKTEIPPENTWSGEHMQPNLLKSADTRYSFKDDENKIVSPEPFHCSPMKTTTAEFRTSLYKVENQPIQCNELIEFGPSHVGVLNESVNQLSKKDVHSAERKRKVEDVMTEKIARIRRSYSGLEFSSDSEISSKGPNLKDLAEIHSRFFKETKLLSHAVDKMNLHAVDHLVDILGLLQRSKTYQLLSNEIQSETILDPASIIQHKRVADTKLLLCKIVHEQAKLQLMHEKRDKLLKSVQSLASGVQESEALTLTYSPQNALKVHFIHSQPFADDTNDSQKCQADWGKATSMKQALEDVNTRISNLTKLFHSSCKMKGEPNPADTVAYVNDHLMKRARRQMLRKDLQLWVLDNLKSSKDHHDVVLNYLDLIAQRLIVSARVAPCISISIRLYEKNIQKNFNNMNATTAFGFVFDVGLTQKHGVTSLAQVTQMTSSLLGNLVDVMEEIQLARIELKNLIHARFHTSSDENLYLELYFFDSNSQKKATLILNSSCLKRGIYPSDIILHQIDVHVDESQNSSSQSLTAQILAAVKDLRVGFSRILRICRCISQLLSSSK